MTEPRLKALANPTNQEILGLLAVEPNYPRRIARLLGVAESEVSRRLRRMAELDLVDADWEHLDGKNVKRYELAVEEIRLVFGPDGLGMEVRSDEGVSDVDVASPAPDPVPPDSGFLGRADELDVLEGPARGVVVTGMPGIGKTELIARFARDRDGPLFWHGFRGPESARWFARRLAVSLPTEARGLLDLLATDADTADVAQGVLAVLDDDELTLVLDDVDRIEDDRLLDLLTEALERPRGAKIVVAARRRPRFDPSRDHVARIQLEGLEDEAVAQLLASEGFDVEPELLPRIRREVGGHPLALRLLAETARGEDVELEALLDRVPESELESWLLGEIHPHLSEGERRVLGLASLFETGFTLEDLRALTDRQVEGILFKIRQRSLVQVRESGYRLHETVRNFFYELLDPGERDRMHGALARHLAKKDTLEDRLRAMHHHLEAGDRARVLGMLESDLDLGDFDVVDAGYHRLYLRVLEAFDPDEIDDADRRALLRDDLGDVRLALGDPETAIEHHEHARKHFEAVGSAERLADVAWKMALAHRELGRPDRAAALVEEGLDAEVEGRARKRLEELRTELGADTAAS